MRIDTFFEKDKRQGGLGSRMKQGALRLVKCIKCPVMLILIPTFAFPLIYRVYKANLSKHHFPIPTCTVQQAKNDHTPGTLCPLFGKNVLVC